MSCLQFRIGPVGWALQAAGAGEIRYPAAAYAPFVVTDGAGWPPPVLMSLAVRAGGCQAPESEPLFRAGRNWALWDDGDGFFVASGREGNPARRGCRVCRRLTDGVLWAGDQPLDSPLRYPLDQVLSWGMLARCGGILLHAAGVVRDGVGLVFAGKSGAGKSTVSGLCHTAGWDVLNDDRVMIYQEVGEWKVAGTPWHGSGRFWQNRQVPLGGIFVLQQDRVDVAVQLGVREARLALLDSVSVPWFEPSWSQGALDVVAAVTAVVPVSRFRFTRSVSAVAALEKQF